MKDLVLEVETLEDPLHVSSSLGTRVRIDKKCLDYELEISGILFTMDLRVMDMSEFDVILGMDWLMAHRVIIDCDRRRVSAYTLMVIVLHFRGISMTLYPKLCTTLGGTVSWWVCWKASPWKTR